MQSHFNRTDRVSGMVQRKLAQILQEDTKDLRLPGLVTISGVQVAKDLAHAKVYFTVFNGDPVEAETRLNALASFLRSTLARTITLRTVPQLHFIHDQSIEYGSRLSRLIDAANSPESPDEPRDPKTQD